MDHYPQKLFQVPHPDSIRSGMSPLNRENNTIEKLRTNTVDK